MESYCGPQWHQEKMVFGHAIDYLTGIFGHWTLLAIKFIFYHHVGIFLDGRIRLGNQRHCIRWLLHDWSNTEKAIILHWIAKHILPIGHGYRTRALGNFRRLFGEQVWR